MNLGHGCQKRTPVWCWLVLSVLALVFIPGGSVMLVEAQEGVVEADSVEAGHEVELQDSSRLPDAMNDEDSGVEHALTASNAAVDADSQVELDQKLRQITDFWTISERECLRIAFENSRVTACKPVAVEADGNIELSRASADLSQVDWADSVIELANSVLRAYSELQFFYENLGVVKQRYEHALAIWKRVNHDESSPKLIAQEREAQAREQYFFFQCRVERAQLDLFKSEERLRSLMGLSNGDNRLIRVAHKVICVEPEIEEWDQLLKKSLNFSPAVKRVRWNVQARELEFQVAMNRLKPSIDRAELYRWLGTSGQSSKKGEAGIPIEHRQELSQVRSSELALKREKAKLNDIELEIEHQLKDVVQDLNAEWKSATTWHSRVVAALEQVEAIDAAFEAGTVALDMLLDADRRYADARIAESQARVSLKLSRISLNRIDGSLLGEYSIRMKEDAASSD